MKSNPMFRPAACLLLFTLVFSACTKTGPAGATGATGPQGAQGPAGAQGPQGDTGVANVQYSPWTGGFSGTSTTWFVTQITQGVIDSAAILVYAQQSGGMFQLPYDNINGSGFYVNDIIDPGYIFLLCDGSDNLNEFKFRWVIIPPGVAATGLPADYTELTRKLNIPE